MGVFIHMRFMRACLCWCLLFCLTLSMPFSSWADTASRIDSISVATSSNALPSQDYMETDDFDTLDVLSVASSGDDTVSNSVDYSGVQMCLAYYDMSGVRHHVFHRSIKWLCFYSSPV